MVVKGALVTCLRPPFEPFGRYRNLCLVAAGTAVLLLAIFLYLGSIEIAIYAGSVLCAGGLFLLNRLAVLLTDVRVYENGLETDIPRSFNRSVYLSWDRLKDYRFEGNTLRYTWQRNGLTVLANGRSETSWPYFYFPSRLKIPEHAMPLLQSLLERPRVPQP